MLDAILSVAAVVVFASGFAGGYLFCHRRWMAEREQWFADARMLASFNNRVYREATTRPHA